MSNSDRPVYVSFDRVPSPKGAAVHIREFVRSVGRELGGVDLVTPDADALVPSVDRDRWPGVDHHRLPSPGRNLIQRAGQFRAHLSRWFTGRRRLVHFRSIFEGYPLALHKDRAAAHLIYEVNGLPSIELKYHHPEVADDRELLAKLRAQEGACLRAADQVITPSQVTADYLIERGADPDKVQVIPNGVDLELFAFQEPGELVSGDQVRVLYAGTMSAWQGVRQAIEALAQYRRDHPAVLTIIGPTRGHQRQQLESWCQQAGVLEYVRLIPPLSQRELAALHHQHDVVLAPLLANDRNTVQGCCPLKILEAMSCGVPVIASDLPVVRALARPDAEALLVRPGSPKAIKDGILRLRREAMLGPRLAHAARRRVESRFTWKRSCERLIDVYRRGLASADTSRSSAPSRDTSALG